MEFHMPPAYANGHISATAHSIHLYSAHGAVIFVIAQLSCSFMGWLRLLLLPEF